MLLDPILLSSLGFQGVLQNSLVDKVQYNSHLLEQYPEHVFPVPVDHFHNDSSYEPHSNDSFYLRYWLDNSYYQEGGPVILLLAGESPGELSFADFNHGIVSIIAKATHGMAVLLEHRYYGSSMPSHGYSTESLRFLTTAQSLADTAYFAANVVLPEQDATRTRPPWIVRGASYAGACAAFLRKLYPDVFWGAIASSAPTQATVDYWRYYEAARLHGPAKCIENTQLLTNAMDNIFTWPESEPFRDKLKAVFGFEGISTVDVEFMLLLGFVGIVKWQALNWDPEISVPDFDWYCGNLSSTERLYTPLDDQESTVRLLLKAGGYADKVEDLTIPMLNWIGFVKSKFPARPNVELGGVRGDNRTSMQHRHPSGPGHAALSMHRAVSRSWTYQLCTQWGLFLPSPPPSSTNSTRHLPVISRLVDLSYFQSTCQKLFNITSPPNVTAINQYGGWGISYPRLALVDGAWDPWREVTPHADLAPKKGRGKYKDEPWLEIERAGHGWDGNGLKSEADWKLVPERIRRAQEMEVGWVMSWVEDWKAAMRNEL